MRLKADVLDEYWSSYYDKGRDFISVTSQELKRLLSHTSNSSRKDALDIGCGTGQLTRELYHNGYRVVGVDISHVALKIAHSLSAAPDTRLSYAHRDIEQEGLSGLPFSPYSLITCRLVYAFIDDQEKFLSQVREVLDQKGKFIIVTPLLDSVPSYKKKIAVDPRTTRKVLEQYFVVKQFEQNELGYFICTKKLKE